MPYYIRVLAERPDPVPLSVLREDLAAGKVAGEVTLDVGSEEDWEQVLLRDETGEEVALVERNGVTPGSLAEAELAEFAEVMPESQPVTGAQWLLKYFPIVQAIYAFQLLLWGLDQANGWQVVWTVQRGLKERLGGIFQADGEGFSNPEGYHILWQFSEDAEGKWSMAILNDQDEWVPFEMDLGNRAHREAFRSGRIPEGAKRW